MLKNVKNVLYAIIGYIGTVDAFVSNAVNTASINSLAFLISVKAGATLDNANYLTLKFSVSDDDVTYADAAAEEYYPDAQLTLKAAQIGVVTALEYRGYKKFVKLVATKTGTTAGDMSVLAVSNHPEAKPSNLG